jgi:hypothetical protein
LNNQSIIQRDGGAREFDIDFDDVYYDDGHQEGNDLEADDEVEQEYF